MDSTPRIHQDRISISSLPSERTEEKVVSLNHLLPRIGTIITTHTRDSENQDSAKFENLTPLPPPLEDHKSAKGDHKSAKGDHRKLHFTEEDASPTDGGFNLDALITEIMLAAEDQNSQIQQTQKMNLEATEVLAQDTAAQGSDLEWSTLGTMSVGIGMGAFQMYGAKASAVNNSMIDNDPAMKALGSANFKTSTQLENSPHNELNLSESEWNAKFKEVCNSNPKLKLNETLGTPEFPLTNKDAQTPETWEDAYNKLRPEARPFVEITGSRNFVVQPGDPNGEPVNEKGLTSRQWDETYNRQLLSIHPFNRSYTMLSLGSRTFEAKNCLGLTRDQWVTGVEEKSRSTPQLAALGRYEFQQKPPTPNQTPDPDAPATNERGLTKAQWEKGYEKVIDRVQIRAQNTGAVRSGFGQASMQLFNVLSGIMQQRQYTAAAQASTSSAEQNTMSSGTTQDMSTASDLRQAISTIMANVYTESSARMA